ncbi:MAG: hypothetical protein ACE5JT_04635 [Nitrosopumilaceae archaeon]
MKSKKVNPVLSIFETFKTKPTELTGEAVRQRGIITHLATESNAAMKTRTSISQKLAEKNGVEWKNVYSGIFIDLDEILVPLRLVEEAGRLPLKRGPKALQEKGVPHYKLTQTGLLVAVTLDEIPDREKIITQFIEKNVTDNDLKTTMLKLLHVGPRFVLYLLRKYVEGYCKGKITTLIPLDPANLRKVIDESVIIQREFLEGFSSSSKTDKGKIISFLKSITS